MIGLRRQDSKRLAHLSNCTKRGIVVRKGVAAVQRDGKIDISICGRIVRVLSVDLGKCLSSLLVVLLEAESLAISEFFLEHLHGFFRAVVGVAEFELVFANLLLESLVPVALVPDQGDHTERHEAARGDETNDEADLVPALVRLLWSVGVLVRVELQSVVFRARIVLVVLMFQCTTSQS